MKYVLRLTALSACAGIQAATIERNDLIVVAPPSRVSPQGAGPHFWWTLAASATDPQRLVICALRNRPDVPTPLQAVLYGSEDGGHTWRSLRDEMASSSSSEPACALGQDAVYFAESRAPWGSSEGQMLLWRSLDFGRTWSSVGQAGYADAAVLLVKRDAATDRNAIAIFADGEEASVLTSNDDATARLDIGKVKLPKESTRPTSSRWTYLSGASWLGDDTLGAVYIDSPSNRYLTFYRVTRTGASIGAPETIAELESRPDSLPPEALRDDRVAAQPWAAIAAGPVPDVAESRLYVAWPDWVDGRRRILLSYSDDAGKAWSRARVVDDIAGMGGTARDTSAALPSLAVSGAGALGMQWAEFEGRCWRFAVSRDGGRTFGASVALNPCALHAPSTLHDLTSYLDPRATSIEANERRSLRLKVLNWRGYWRLNRSIGLVALADNTFHAAWVSFAADDDAIYATAIRVDANSGTSRPREVVSQAENGIRTGRWRFDRHSDITFTGISFDEVAGEFQVGVVVRRPVAERSRWPAVLRMRGVRSLLGPVRAVDVDGGTGTSAAWVFDGPVASLPYGSRAALQAREPSGSSYEYSRARLLRFRLEAPAATTSIPLGNPDGAAAEILTADFEVLVPATP